MRIRLALAALLAATVAVLVVSPWASGTPRATAKPAVINGYSHTELGPISFTPTPTTVASMPLPGGKYLANAKVIVVVPTGPADVECTLIAGGPVDAAAVEQLRGDGQGAATLALAGPLVLPSAGTVEVKCATTGGGGTGQAQSIVVEAIKVTSLRATATG